jgi:hypothetical protein
VWHVDSLLVSDHEISSHTTVVTRRPLNCNRGIVFSVWSMLRCYKQDKLGVASQSDNCWGSVGVSCCCEKSVGEARDSLGTQRKQNVHCWKLATKLQLVKANRPRIPSVPYNDM